MKVIRSAKDDTIRLQSWIALTEEIYTAYPDSVLQICSRVVHTVDEKLPTASGQLKRCLLSVKAEALNNSAAILDTRGVNTIDIYRQSAAIDSMISDSSQLSGVYNNMGYVFRSQGNVRLALFYYGKSLQIKQALHDSARIAVTLNNIGSLLEGQGEVDKALENYRSALDICTRMKNKKGIADELNNIACVYRDQGKLEEALKMFYRTMELRKAMRSKKGIAEVYINIGTIYSYWDSAAPTIRYYLLAKQYADSTGDPLLQARVYSNIGHYYFKQGDPGRAEHFCRIGLEKAKVSMNIEMIGNTSLYLKDIYLAEKKYKEAEEMFELGVSMRDSIHNSENRKLVYKQQLKFEYEKKEAERVLQEQKKELEYELNAKQQRIILWSVVAVLVLLTGFAFILFNRIKITQKQKRIIEQQKAVVDEKNKDMLDSIRYAKRIQDAILPNTQFVKNLLPDSFIFYRPKDIVSGDLYFMEQWGSKIFVAAIDCTGHGVPGAFMSIVAHNLLNEAILEHGIDRPSLILNAMDKGLSKILKQRSDSEVRDGMDIALCALDRKNMKLEFAGANNPLWIISGDTMTEVKADKKPIGHFGDNEQKLFTHHEVELKPGDCFYIFTDGYADQFGGPKRKKFKYRPMQELVHSVHSRSMDEQEAVLRGQFLAWKDNLEQVDDVLVIGVRV